MNRLVAFLSLSLGVSAVPATEPTLPPATQAINELIAEKWKEVGIKSPARKATELEFQRRAFIDLIGRIPSVEEAKDFEADTGPDKRARLIRRLLYDEKYVPRVNGNPVQLAAAAGSGGKPTVLTFNYAQEYADHWADVWTVWLMTRTSHPMYRAQLRDWLSDQFKENRSYQDIVTVLLTATGSTNENPPANFVIQHLGEDVPAEKRGQLGRYDAVPITSRVTRLFLGVQTQCAQCHDHPFNKEWVQSDFWGVNAYFRQANRSANPTPGVGPNGQATGNAVNVELSDDTSINPDGVVFFERRDGKLMAAKPNFLKDMAQAERGELPIKTPAVAGGPERPRRQILAEFVVNHDNFAPALVNRYWGHLFGRGLNKEPAVDDFGSNNEVVHPELLGKLAAEFAKYNFDLKRMLEWICLSNVYALSHEAVPAYADPKYDPYFARMPLKAMSPEVLYRSIITATKSERGANSQSRSEARDRFLARLVRNFGDDEGNEVSFNGTVIQALLLMNGQELNDEITRTGNNVVEELVRRNSSRGGGVRSGAIVDDLFLMTLNRHPTAHELAVLSDFQKGTRKVKVEVAPAENWAPQPSPKGNSGSRAEPKPKAVTGTLPGANPNDVTFYQDVFWALLNTNEFILNH